MLCFLAAASKELATTKHIPACMLSTPTSRWPPVGPRASLVGSPCARKPSLKDMGARPNLCRQPRHRGTSAFREDRQPRITNAIMQHGLSGLELQVPRLYCA
ncbi:hypothetical protein CBOM_07787 [Ceraceosorus bombacis]|uniref:Uncharacterized protein n=1 Tax=Ceraceosorus bombacis TaxID=401625 RepID=A0A0P1BP81_9BASI|nr:hypothetical protein CBOM_07787 [Ceraceosorus bombacis]